MSFMSLTKASSPLIVKSENLPLEVIRQMDSCRFDTQLSIVNGDDIYYFKPKTNTYIGTLSNVDLTFAFFVLGFMVGCLVLCIIMFIFS